MALATCAVPARQFGKVVNGPALYSGASYLTAFRESDCSDPSFRGCFLFLSTENVFPLDLVPSDDQPEDFPVDVPEDVEDESLDVQVPEQELEPAPNPGEEPEEIMIRDDFVLNRVAASGKPAKP